MSKSLLSREEWQQRVNQWLESGMSAKMWCQVNQISYPTFIGWKNRLKESPLNSLSTTFVELKNDEKPSAITLEYKDVKIHLSDNFDEGILRRCLHTLRDG